MELHPHKELLAKQETDKALQTVRSNEQMMQSMKGATSLLGSMNRQMNLPALQRIAMEFEKENDIMDQRQDMMDDAIDDVTGLEDDEEEGEEVVNKVLDEIGVDLGQSVCDCVVDEVFAIAMLTIYSSARLRKVSKATLSVKAKSLKQLVVAIRVMTTCKHALTVYEDNDDKYSNDDTFSSPVAQQFNTSGLQCSTSSCEQMRAAIDPTRTRPS